MVAQQKLSEPRPRPEQKSCDSAYACRHSCTAPNDQSYARESSTQTRPSLSTGLQVFANDNLALHITTCVTEVENSTEGPGHTAQNDMFENFSQQHCTE